jgi:hypothetical protein
MKGIFTKVAGTGSGAVTLKRPLASVPLVVLAATVI